MFPTTHPLATKTDRARVLTSTDVRKLAAGEWLDVWREKMGLTPPLDLSHVFKVQLGLCTEQLHGEWHGKTERCQVRRCPDQPCRILGQGLPDHYASTFDYWIVDENVPLELKHTNERNNLYDAAQFYMPQLQWQMLIAGTGHLRFSIIRGNNEPEWGRVDRDDDYITRLRGQADAFWTLVTDKIEPSASLEADAELPELAKGIRLNGLKPYDYGTNNAWVSQAQDYAELKVHADRFKQVDKDLRALIPGDASVVTGGGLQAKRDARGAYRFTILESTDA